MIDALLAKVFGTKNEREVKALLPTVAAINELEPGIRALSDIDLAAKTIEFKERIAQGATLDDLLVEAFAVVREAGRRTLNMRHFDVQLIGGMVLHKGKIAEMKTGEAKPWSLPCPATSTHSLARASTWLRSTIIWPNVTRNGWAACISSSACRWV